MTVVDLVEPLPLPPLEMRQRVGPTDPAVSDNPGGNPIFANVPKSRFGSVPDFGRVRLAPAIPVMDGA